MARRTRSTIALLSAFTSSYALDATRGAAPRPTLWVCGNRWCRERGAAVALGAPLALAPDVDVRPRGCFGRCGEGPNAAAVVGGATVEWHAVDSVEKVRRILEKYLRKDVDESAAQCLELHFLAEAAAKRKDLELAARLYGAPGRTSLLWLRRDGSRRRRGRELNIPRRRVAAAAAS